MHWRCCHGSKQVRRLGIRFVPRRTIRASLRAVEAALVSSGRVVADSEIILAPCDSSSGGGHLVMSASPYSSRQAATTRTLVCRRAREALAAPAFLAWELQPNDDELAFRTPPRCRGMARAARPENQIRLQ